MSSVSSIADLAGDGAAGTERFARTEYKLAFPNGCGDLPVALLEAFALDDPDYPAGFVNSVYFDTIGLGFYHDALDGQYERRKVRLRWYGELPADGDVAVWLEVKSKRGARSNKVRQPMLLDSRLLAHDRLGDLASELPLVAMMAGMGQAYAEPLQPTALIRYRRRRWVDPVCGARLSLDQGVTALGLLPHWATQGAVALLAGVVEIKSDDEATPMVAHNLLAAGCHWTSFSKYAFGMTALAEVPGTFGGHQLNGLFQDWRVE